MRAGVAQSPVNKAAIDPVLKWVCDGRGATRGDRQAASDITPPGYCFIPAHPSGGRQNVRKLNLVHLQMTHMEGNDTRAIAPGSL